MSATASCNRYILTLVIPSQLHRDIETQDEQIEDEKCRSGAR